MVLGGGAVSYERGTPVWHVCDSQGQILALAFRYKSLKHFKVFLLRSVQGYLAHKKQPPPPKGHHRTLGMILL